MNQYPIPAAPFTFKEEIKKSRFITHIAHTPGIENAKAFINEIKAAHAGARHNCWAYVAGAPSDTMQLGFSDDGEPSGTAGKPILAQLQGSGIGEITAVVTRYSGGIKLGTGGLVRAYGGGVKQALSELNSINKQKLESISIEYPYTLESAVNNCIRAANGTIIKTDYNESIKMQIEIPVESVKELKRSLVIIGAIVF